MSIYIYTLIHTHTDSGIHVGLQEGGTALQIALDRKAEMEGTEGCEVEAVKAEEVVAVLEEHMAKGGEKEEKERVVCRAASPVGAPVGTAL